MRKGFGQARMFPTAKETGHVPVATHPESYIRDLH